MRFPRRQFLGAGTAVAFGMSLPGLFRRTAVAAPRSDQPGAKSTVLVVVQLSGGNDGLNTVIPDRDPLYAAARPTLKPPRERVRRINDDLAFHPALGGFSELLERSELTILQGIGYPQPNRSHFASMDIWHKAADSLDAVKAEQYGWLGRTHAQLGSGNQVMTIGSGDPPLATFGPSGFAPSVTSLQEYQLRVSLKDDDPAKRAVIEGFVKADAPSSNELLNLVRASAREMYRSSERLRQAASRYETPVSYPATGLGQRLKLIAQLITAGVPERVYYTSLGGFDTHAVQAPAHTSLLSELGDAIAAFQKDLRHQGQHERVVVVTFSEFGRRVKENASEGTDHGAASQMFLIGSRVRPGIVGAHPRLDQLEDGDLRHHTDFRSVYATLLTDWLGVASEPVLGRTFPRIELIKDRTSGTRG